MSTWYHIVRASEQVTSAAYTYNPTIHGRLFEFESNNSPPSSHNHQDQQTTNSLQKGLSEMHDSNGVTDQVKSHPSPTTRDDMNVNAGGSCQTRVISGQTHPTTIATIQPEYTNHAMIIDDKDANDEVEEPYQLRPEDLDDELRAELNALPAELRTFALRIASEPAPANPTSIALESSPITIHPTNQPPLSYDSHSNKRKRSTSSSPTIEPCSPSPEPPPSDGIRRGFIPFEWENAVDQDTPSQFLFISQTYVHPSSRVGSTDDIPHVGCDCPEGDCKRGRCQCSQESEAQYDSNGRIDMNLSDSTPQRYRECWSGCSCQRLEQFYQKPTPAIQEPATVTNAKKKPKGRIKQTAKRLARATTRSPVASSSSPSFVCFNRVVQRGVVRPDLRLVVFKCADGRGWGLKTLTRIEPRTYVCDYVGERTHELLVQSREKKYQCTKISSYLFTPKSRHELQLEPTKRIRKNGSGDSDEDGSDSDDTSDHSFNPAVINLVNEPYSIDAYRMGHVSRFINHSHQPNLIMVEVLIETLDHRLPHGAFFAGEETIEPDTELTFDYGTIDGFQCMCGECPSEEEDESMADSNSRSSSSPPVSKSKSPSTTKSPIFTARKTPTSNASSRASTPNTTHHTRTKDANSKSTSPTTARSLTHQLNGVDQRTPHVPSRPSIAPQSNPNTTLSVNASSTLIPSTPHSSTVENGRHCWSVDDDHRLLAGVEKFGGKNWRRIAEYAFGRSKTANQCLLHYSRVLRPGLVRGPWTIKEDDRLVELVGQMGVKKWAQIASILSTRTGDQCRARWYGTLSPDKRKGAWSSFEDELILASHASFGGQWTRISKLLPGRTDKAIKNRWNTITQGVTTDQSKPVQLGLNELSRPVAAAAGANANEFEDADDDEDVMEEDNEKEDQEQPHTAPFKQ